MGSVVFDQVTKRFGGVVALADLDLNIGDGEFMVLVGPSGSGKTTALRMLAGLEALSSGHVSIDGKVVDRVPPKERDIAMVFQDYGLYPQMTVFKNLAFGLRMRKVSARDIEQRVALATESLGLGDLLQRKPRELSGGQRQRVALGRALVREPKVFLMDEPLSNLDAKLRVQTRGEIRRLQLETHITTVYVTHDQVEAMTMGDRIAVMNDSRLEQLGDPETLYEAPSNRFVAGFIGSPAMEFNDFTTSRGDKGVLELRRGSLVLTIPTTVEVPTEVVVGVRPEHACLWSSERNLLGPLEGSAQFVEAMGRETFIGVGCDDGRFVVRGEGRVATRIGERVQFGVRSGCVYIFDPSTGNALGRL
jgi:ABC-type sugar transport system ATPase subunit